MALSPQGEPKGSDGAHEPAVLVIEPNEEHQVLSTVALGRRGFRVTIAGTAREGMRLALSQTFAAIVMDFKVRDMPALEVLSVLRLRVPDVPKIFVVTAGQEATAVRALSSGASGYLVKTARYNELLPSEVETQIRAAAARKSLKEQKQALGESEERFQKAFRASPVAISLNASPDARFIDANDALVRLTGYSREELVGRTVDELHLMVDDDAIARVRSTFAKDGAVRESEAHLRTKSGDVRTLSISMDTVVIEGAPCILTLARDVTEERQAERLRTSLYEIGDATETARDLPDLFHRIHAIIARLMPAPNCYFALYDPGTDELSFPYFVDEREAAPAPYRAGRGLTEYVLRTGAPLLVSPASLANLVSRGEVELVGAEGTDWLGVPLSASGRTFGVLAVQTYGESTRYGEREKEVLGLVSAQVAMAIDRRASRDALRRAEARFRTMFKDAPMGIFLVSTDGRIQETNPAVQRMLGYTADELEGKTIRDITLPADVDETVRLFDSLVRGECGSYRLEKRYLRKDGSLVWVRLTATLLRSSDAVNTSVLGMVQGITDERTAQEEREAESRRFHAMIEHISDGITLMDPGGTVTWQSPSGERLFGRSLDEVTGKSGFDFIDPEDAAQLAPMFADLLSTPGKSLTAEFRVRHKNGSWRWMEAIGTNLLSNPDLHALIMNYRDITDRNEALEHIRFQASLLSQVRNAVIAIDNELRVVYWNEAAAAMLGWNASEVVGRPVQSILPTQEIRAEMATILDELRRKGHYAAELSAVRKNGARFPVEMSITTLRGRSEELVGYVAVASDVTERANARHELEIRARQQAAIASLGQKALAEPLLSALLGEVVDTVARTLDVEFASVLELGPDRSSFTLKAKSGWGRALGDHMPNDPRTTMAGYTLASGTSVAMEDAREESRFELPTLFRTHGILSGLCVVIPGAAEPYGVLTAHSKRARPFSPDDLRFAESVASVVANTLARNRIEKILSENERMASMGQLAAYVAHEVNTPLTNISLLASSIARRETDPEILQKVAAISEQRRKATAIVMDILEFPKERSSRHAPEDIRQVISAALAQVEPYRRSNVELVTELGDRAAFANVDAIQIRDVFANLLKNALEATAEGRVIVSLKELPEFLLVSVTDTGTGLSREVLDQLFHPLSSLESDPEGPSLGLAVSRAIVAAHGGKIEATSEVGKGSTFTVILPRRQVS